MGAMSPTHWLIVIAVFVLLFGAKKLPDLARSAGQSARVLKGEMKGLRGDDAADEAAANDATEVADCRTAAGALLTPSGTPDTRTATTGATTRRD